MHWFLYILECRDATFYVGITTDVAKRLQAHNDGTAARYTRGRRPVRLIYHEKHRTMSAARRREIQIKNWPREKKTRLISTKK